MDLYIYIIIIIVIILSGKKDKRTGFNLFFEGNFKIKN